MVITRDGGTIPALEDLPDSEIEIWRDNDGGICSYGYADHGTYWMYFPGVASFCFRADGGEVKAIAPPTISEELLRDLYQRAVLPMALPLVGTEVLHASGVLTPRGVVAFCGTSGTGKSTLARGMAAQGYPQWADDAVAFEVNGPVVQAIPLPFSSRLLPDAAAHFGGGQAQSFSSLLFIPAAQAHEKPEPLLALVEIQRYPADEAHPEAPTISPLKPADAFTAVLPHAYCFTLKDREIRRRMVQNYLELAALVPAIRVRFQAGLENLPHLAVEIDAAIASLPARR